MSRYLITQTLISSWSYAHTCREECFEEALQDFYNTLNRIPKELTKEMQNGIDFENEVYKEAAGVKRDFHDKWENGIKAVATVIKGAPVQVRVQREFSVGEHKLLLYGVLDALKGGTIYDVKFSNKSFHSAELAGKYLNSPQHSAYLFALPEARSFTYLVSDGEDLYTESYTKRDTRPFEDIVSEFIDSLKTMNLFDTYKEKWAAKW